jgi:uncharacterized integral membrane protein
MNFLKNFFYFAVVLVMLGLGALFAVQNTASVPLDLLVVSLPERSVALWVLLAFAVGGVTGMLTSIGLVLRLRTALMRANRQLARIKPSAELAGAPAAAEATEGEEAADAKEN